MNEPSRDLRVVDQCYEKVDGLVEVDYGDFKRKVGSYLTRLQDSLATRSESYVKQSLSQIREKVMFSQKQNVEASRNEVLKVLEDLRQKLDS
jgi:hypothetical protein